MFGFGGSVKIYYCPTPVNMRKSFDGLAGAVEEYINQDPESGHVFAFFSRNKKLVKLLHWEDTIGTRWLSYSAIGQRPNRIDQSRIIRDSVGNQTATLLQKICEKSA